MASDASCDRKMLFLSKPTAGMRRREDRTVGLTRSRGREHRSSGGRKAQAKEREGKESRQEQTGRHSTQREATRRDEQWKEEQRGRLIPGGQARRGRGGTRGRWRMPNPLWLAGRRPGEGRLCMIGGQ